MSLRRTFDAFVRRMRPPEPRPLILVYHRIANEPADPWGLTVRPAHFEEQLRVLRRTRRPVPLKVRAAVAGAGFACGCATTNGPAGAASDIFALPRVQVLDWDGEAFERALQSASADGQA